MQIRFFVECTAPLAAIGLDGEHRSQNYFVLDFFPHPFRAFPSDPMDIKNCQESNIRSLAVTSRESITRLAVAIDVGARKAGWVNRWAWKGAPRVWGTHHARNMYSRAL